MGNYELSIVTPFHNIEMEIFKDGFESMKNQTIGFENVEWIIVVHNSEDKYYDAVVEMSKPYENIKVYRLDNDKKTPSSPRNYGMSLATSKYIGFLDGDDSYLPDCFKSVVQVIKEEKSQIVCFRREYELETEGATPVTEITLWNQTYDKIVLDRDTWDDEKIFTGVWGMVTSRIYDLTFLRENNLCFDESVLFAEDFLFNYEAYGHAKKVVYLPQLIGYHYFINGGSLVQSGEKDGATLIQYAKGYAKIFDTGIKYGFYTNSVIQRLSLVLTRFMVNNKKLTYEDRVEIKNILEPYILQSSHIKVSKVFSEKAVNDAYEVPRDVILHPEKWANAEESELLASVSYQYMYNTDPMIFELMNILDANCNTDIGRRYEFSRIVSTTHFEEKVPVYTQDEYQSFIKLTTRIGESKIFVNEPVSQYSFSPSETIGQDNILFPHTAKSSEKYGKALDKMIGDSRVFFLFESLPKVVKYNDNTKMNSVFGIALSEYRKLLNNKSINTNCREDVLFPDAVQDTMSDRVIYGLFDGELETIVAPSIWHVINLIKDIKKLFDEKNIESSSVYQTLSVDKERANVLKEIFAGEFNDGIIKKIWPKLNKIYAPMGGTEEVYLDEIKKYVDLSMISGGYLIDNIGIIGIPCEEGNGYYELNRKSGYYEFGDLSSDKVVSIKNVEEGKSYELIATTYNGLIRYRTGLAIKVISNTKDRLVFMRNYNINQNLVIDAEGTKITVTERDVYENIKYLGKTFGFLFNDFSYCDMSIKTGDNKPCVTIIIETGENLDDSTIEKMTNASKEAFYKKYNISNKESVDVKVMLGDSESHLLFRDTARYYDDLLQDQIKPMRLLKSAKDIAFFTR